jgi:hypothetical protein
LRELGQPTGDRIGQVEGALFEENHRRDRGDRLGHRVDAPQSVDLDRPPGLDVGVPAPCQVRDSAAAGDHD